MSHFAKLDQNNVVLEVHVVHNNELLDQNGVEQEWKGVWFLQNWSGGYPHWKQTSFSGRIRKNYANRGFIYDPVRDAFIAPQPTPDAVLDEETCQWIVPVINAVADSIGADSV
jgi:hypothetical protein